MLTDFQRITAYAEVEVRSFGGAYEARTKGGLLSATDCTERGALKALAQKLPAGCALTITRIRNR